MVFLALKKISAWDHLLKYLEQENTAIGMVPGHQRVKPTETKAQLTTALGKQMKMWTQSGRESKSDSGSLLSFRASELMQSISLKKNSF